MWLVHFACNNLAWKCQRPERKAGVYTTRLLIISHLKFYVVFFLFFFLKNCIPSFFLIFQMSSPLFTYFPSLLPSFSLFSFFYSVSSLLFTLWHTEFFTCVFKGLIFFLLITCRFCELVGIYTPGEKWSLVDRLS